MTAEQPRIRLERLFGYMYDHLNRAYILNQGGLKLRASALSDHGDPGKVAESSGQDTLDCGGGGSDP